MGAVGCQCVPQYPLWSTHLYLEMLIAMSHWFEALALATSMLSSPGLLWDFLMMPCVVEIVQLWIKEVVLVQLS